MLVLQRTFVDLVFTKVDGSEDVRPVDLVAHLTRVRVVVVVRMVTRDEMWSGGNRERSQTYPGLVLTLANLR